MPAHNLELTRHARGRLQSRGYRKADLSLLFACAEQVGPHEFFLSRQAAQEAVGLLKKQVQAIERLAGSLLVAEGNTVITIQRAFQKKQRRLMRKERQ